MGRPTNRDQRRREITGALSAVMAEKGYASATIQEIAKAAGLRPGLIHYHFSSKQNILIALLEELSEQFIDRYEQLVENVHTPEGLLEAFIEAQLGTGEGASETAMASWVAIGSEAVRQPEVRELYEEIIQRQKRLLEELLFGCGLDEEEADDFATQIIAVTEGIFRLASSTDHMIRPGSASDNLKNLVKRYLMFRNEQTA